MNFVQTILLFAGLVAAVLVPIFVGHALSTHHNQFYGYAAGALVVSLVLLAAHMKSAPDLPESSHH